MKIDNDTFGNSNMFKSLKCINEHIEKNNLPQIKTFLAKANEFCKDIDDSNIKHKEYIFKLLKNNLLSQIDSMIEKYDVVLLSHLKCFISGKINSLINKHNQTLK